MENYCDGPLKKSPKTTPILPNNVKVSALGQNNDDNLPKNSIYTCRSDKWSTHQSSCLALSVMATDNRANGFLDPLTFLCLHAQSARR